jgi:NitT/TauT family transport system permease protein
MTFKWPELPPIGRRVAPNVWDFVAFALIIAAFVAVAEASRGMVMPLPPTGTSTVTLDYVNLPYYALRTTARMFLALGASFLFTFTYATLAAKSRRAEMVLIPILDVLQSVPVLGFLSFTVTVFLGLFPGSTLARNAPRSSRSSQAKPGTWHSPFINRSARYRATSRK